MSSENDTHDLSGLKVLVAENDRMNLIRLYEMLMSLGLEVIVTHKSIDAVEKNLIEKPDIILINIDMPEFNENDAIKIIRKNESKNKHVVIIGLTENIPSNNGSDATVAGPDIYMKHGFAHEELYDVLQNSDVKKKIKQLELTKTKANQAVVFNKEAFIQLMDIGNEKRKALLESFIQDTSKLIITLKLATAVKYFPEIEQFAHSIKGNAGNVGAEKLKITAYHIEIIGKSNDLRKLNECGNLLEELEVNFKKAKQEIQDFLSKK